MSGLLEIIGGKVRDLAANQGLPVGKALSEALDNLAESAVLVDEEKLRADSMARISGFGALQEFLADSEVEELWMNRPNELFVNAAGTTKRIFIDMDADQQQVVIDRMLRHIGRRIDRSTPFVDAPLEDGSRLHAVIPDITRQHMSFNIRKFQTSRPTLDDLSGAGVLSQNELGAVRECLNSGGTILVSGATAAGKTTFLCALANDLTPTVRVVSAEDTFEISLKNLDWVAMQTRSESVEGAGEVDLRRLVRESLRMRPGRLIIGEVRGAEALELLVALNSGIPALFTIHANDAPGAMQKLLTLPLLSGVDLPVNFLREVFCASVALIVQLSVQPDGTRKVVELVRPRFKNDEVSFESIG